MPHKLVVKLCAPTDPHGIANQSDIFLQTDDQEPQKLTLVSRVVVDVDVDRPPTATLYMFLRDFEGTVVVSADQAAAILKIEQGRSLHFLNDEDGKVLENLFRSPLRTTDREREALGKILLELDLRAAARSKVGGR